MRQQAGFSLLELLVTLFVIVLVTSMVTLNVSTGGRDIQLENVLRELADAGSYALDEAQFSGTDYGLVLWREAGGGEPVRGFGWRERRQGQWYSPASGKDIFAATEFPDWIELELELEGILVDQELLVGPRDGEPQLVFYASGETTPGALDVLDRDSGSLLWRLEWDLLGRFVLLPRGIPEDEFL